LLISQTSSTASPTTTTTTTAKTTTTTTTTSPSPVAPKGGRIVQDRTKDEASRTNEGQGQRNSVIIGQV